MRGFFYLITVLIVVVCSSCATLSQRDWTVPPDFLGATARQAVVVRATGPAPQAMLTLWEKRDGEWKRRLGPWPAVVGRNGFAVLNEKREGDGKTPSGIFPLGPAFGRDVSLPTGLDYRMLDSSDRWVDDPASAQYNQWIKGETTAASFETMLRPDGLYDAGLVVQYNMVPVIPGRGSAIFIHIWRDKGTKPTAGCVALEHRHVLELLQELDPKKAPVVVLGK